MKVVDVGGRQVAALAGGVLPQRVAGGDLFGDRRGQDAGDRRRRRVDFVFGLSLGGVGALPRLAQRPVELGVLGEDLIGPPGPGFGVRAVGVRSTYVGIGGGVRGVVVAVEVPAALGDLVSAAGACGQRRNVLVDEDPVDRGRVPPLQPLALQVGAPQQRQDLPGPA
ncbi:hypothetical protein [Actinomadura sp. 21ATH]|uniref:hypothetical protein n=1 Tax=Actinomadura sp. 21ATH TaxID=1735444 RepID=UPI0035C15A99